MSKIFSHASSNQPPVAAAPASSSSTGTTSQPGTSSPAPQKPAPATAASAPRPPSSPGAGASVPAQQPVDVTAALDGLAKKNPEKLDWKNSIVDLMKLVGMDSSLSARKALADDLHYSGDKSDSATMNIWLHKAVMKKLAENGAKIPQDLLKK